MTCFDALPGGRNLEEIWKKFGTYFLSMGLRTRGLGFLFSRFQQKSVLFLRVNDFKLYF